jgi:hypothetical protein
MMNANQCRGRAATAETNARAMTDPLLRAQYLEHERLWIFLAGRAEAQDGLQLKQAEGL